MELPLISVIIPVLNNHKKCNQAVRSVLSQTYPNFELIVIDDCSSPPISLPDDSRIKLFRNRVNEGAAHSRNRGVANAKGEYIAFLDSDDRWLDIKLERQWRHLYGKQNMHAHEERPLAISVGTRVISKTKKRNELLIPVGSSNETDFLSGNWFFPGTALLIKESNFDELGGFDKHLRRLEDFEFFIRFCRQGGELVVLDEELCVVNREPHARLDHVRAACGLIFQKHFGSIHGLNKKRVFLSYLMLETGSTAFYEKKYIEAILYLFCSILLVPRLRVSLKDWWVIK